MKLLNYSFLMCLIFMCGCSDSDNDNIALSKNFAHLTSTEQTHTITVNADMDWIVDKDADWCEVTPQRGSAGTTTVNIVVEPNPKKSSRQANINFNTGSNSVSFLLTQAATASEIISVQRSNLPVEKEGLVFFVENGENYQAVTPAAQNWIIVTEGKEMLQIEVAENTGEQARIGKIEFKDKKTSQIYTMMIVQNATAEAKAFLELEKFTIDGIQAVIDVNTKEIYFSVDMDLPVPVLQHKIEFEGLGVDYVTMGSDAQKIYSGDTYTFSEFSARTVVRVNTYNDNWEDDSNQHKLNITGLPLVTVYAPEGIIDEYKLPCDITLIDPKGRTDGDKIVFESHAGIEFRGSGALRYPKKAFSINLKDRDTWESLDHSLLGLRNDNKWILDAMWTDHGNMRNRVCFDVWNEFNKPYYIDKEPKALTGTNGYLVELFLDGAYHGMYTLSDRLDRKQLKLKKDGGYLYKTKDWTNECLLRGISSMYDNNSLMWNGVEMNYPDELGKVEFKYYYDLVKFVSEVDENNPQSVQYFNDNFESMVDVAGLVDFFLYLNLMVAYDNIGRNDFWGIYNVSKGTQMVPFIWDMDGTLGRDWDGNKESPQNGFLVYSRHNGYSYTIFKWIVKLDPVGIQQKIRNRWNDLKDGALSPDNIDAKVNYYLTQQVDSGSDKREQNRWQNDRYTDAVGEANYIKDWYRQRHAYFDTLINNPVWVP